MAKKHEKILINKMQIQTTLRFYLTPVRIATIMNTNNKCWRRCGGKRNPYTLLVGMKTSTNTMENSMEAPQKTKNRSAMQSSNTTPRNRPKEI
jgi:hypothetical protein